MSTRTAAAPLRDDHRALLGSFERFFGVLIEHYGAQFPYGLPPSWLGLSPWAKKRSNTPAWSNAVCVRPDCACAWIRPTTSSAKRIRNDENEKIPYVLVVGEQEQTQNKVAVRKKGEGDKGAMEVGRSSILSRRN
jgi:threonyl-tRNA synthetase